MSLKLFGTLHKITRVAVANVAHAALKLLWALRFDSLLRVGRVSFIRFFNVIYLIIVNLWLVSYSEQYLGIYFLPR